MKKRNQHYVFQAYLAEWRNEDRQIWCLRDSKIFNSDTKNVAQERDFYRILELNNDERKFLVEFFWSQEPPVIKKSLISHLNQCQISFAWEKRLNIYQDIVADVKNTGMVTEGTIDKLTYFINYLNECVKNASSECDTQGRNEIDFWKKEIGYLDVFMHLAGLIAKNKVNAGVQQAFEDSIKKFEAISDETTINLEEDFLASIEAETLKWMKALKERNFEEFGQINKRDIFFDIAVQYFRTKAIRDNFQTNLRAKFSDRAFIEGFYKFQPNINLANVHVENITHSIFWGWQTAVANSLYKRKACITLLVNETSTPFITSDQPLINLKVDYEKLQQLQQLQQCEVKELLFYYPLSPRIAITVDADNSSEKIDTVYLQIKDVEEYNNKMVKASHEIIFANEKGILEKINEGKKNEDVVACSEK